MEIRTLVPSDVPALIALRREALAASPLAFGASLEDDLALSAEFLRERLADAESSAILGAFEAGTLVGMVGLARQRMRKARHLAIVWGMYVTPNARGRGAGEGLMRAAIARARTWPGVLQLHLAVSDAAPEAERLYRRVGFRAWGVEPRALQWDGAFVDERHMVLALDDRS